MRVTPTLSSVRCTLAARGRRSEAGAGVPGPGLGAQAREAGAPVQSADFRMIVSVGGAGSCGDPM